MPIGFSDILKTTAQITNSLTKGIVSTDDTYGGIRSKIDDWTDLHTSTYNDGAGYTFQDEGTGSAPGHFKAYSTMFYVADGRALIETATSAGAIRLDSNGEYVSAGGQLYTHDPSGTPEPEYWVLIDPTQIGGSGSGTDKLPKFTITGTQGSNSTAVPAGYQKLNVVTQAASTVDSFSTFTIKDESNASINITNEDTVKIVGAGAVSTALTAPAGEALLTITVPTAAVTDGSANYVTGDHVYDFVTTSTAIVLEDEGGDTLNITNGGTLKIAGANGVSTDIASFGGNQSLVITVPDATSTVSGLVQLISNDVQTEAANSVTTTSGRTYGVQFNSDDQLVVNVPWTSNSGTVTEVTSATTSQLTVADGTSTPALSIVTGAVTNGGTALATGDQIYDFVIGYAASGTNNSTDVTLASVTNNYLTLSGQEITAGTVPVTLGGTGLTTIAAGSLLHATSSNTLAALTGGAGEDGYLVSYDHATTSFELIAATATANDSIIEFTGTGITFGSSFSTNQSSDEQITVTLAQELQDIAGLSGTGLLTYDGTNVSLDAISYIDNIDVTEGTDGTTYKVLMTSAAAGGNFTGTFIDTNDLKFTPATLSERGKLETGDLLVKGNLTVLGAGTDINLQRENLIVRDPNIVLGAIADSGGSITGTATGDVGITAYIDGTDDPILQYNKTNDYWEINNQDHASAPTLKIAQKFTATITAASSNVITHNLNTRDVIVQARDTNDEVVYIKYDCTSDQQTTVFFGTGTVDETIDIVIIG